MAVPWLVRQLVLALEPRSVELEFLNIKIIMMLYFLIGNACLCKQVDDKYCNLPDPEDATSCTS